MSKIKKFTISAVVFLFIGCPARSAFPLFSDGQLFFNPSLLGTWVDENKEAVYTFQASGDKSYRLTILENHADTLMLKVQLGHLGKSWFLDSYPLGESHDYHMLRTHLFSKMWLEGDTLRTSSLEGDWLKKMADDQKLTIPYFRVDGEIVLTASTEQLQRFISRFADDKDAFPTQGKLSRSK